MNARIREADRLIDPILDAGFDFNRKEALEIDPKKLEFVSDEAALKERWRLTLKMQVLDSYFEELEDRKKAEQKKAGQGQPRQGATTAAAPEPVPDPAAHPEQMRSNPVTYIGAYDDIRKLYSALPLSKQMGYQPYFFSFNKEGGRCEVCKGEGSIVVEMQSH